MNKYFIGAGICFFLAVVCFAASAASGEETLHFFLIFPVITVNTVLSGIGAIFILLTFLLGIMGFFKGFEIVGWDEFQDEFAQPSGQRTGGPKQGTTQGSRGPRIEGGGVVLIGPVPIIFGSNQKLTLIIVVLTLAIMVVALMFFMV